MQVKDNQKTIHQEAKLRAKKLAPLFAQTQKAHGRIDEREVAIQSVTPMQIGFPHVQTVIKIWRKSTAHKTGEKEICYYLSSEPFDRRTPEQWLELVRGHWGGVEIRNHWRKDARLLEDKTRSRNPTLVGAFAILRNILLFTHKEQDNHVTLPGFAEDIAANESKSFSMLMRRGLAELCRNATSILSFIGSSGFFMVEESRSIVKCVFLTG